MGTDIFSILNGSTSDNSLIPSRDPGAVTGTAFINDNMHLTGPVREENILNELTHGNMPDFLRNFIPITVSDGVNSISYLVLPDVLSIGSNEDFVRMPMAPLTAQAIADQYDCVLPTKKMAHDIWNISTNKIAPHPHGPPYDASMFSTERYKWHHDAIQQQINNIITNGILVGHKKDVVLTNKLNPHNPKKRVAIYGWIQLNGVPIQGLNPVDHDINYADYSHGIRLIAKDVVINGTSDRIENVFSDTKLSALLSDEGPLTFIRY